MSRGLLFILRLETLRSRAESSGGFDTHLEPCLWGHGVWTSHILCSVEKIKVFGLYFYLYHDCIVPMNAEKEQGVGCWFSSCVWNHRARGDPRYQPHGSLQPAGSWGWIADRELEASEVLYLKPSSVSGCRLQGRWRDKGCLLIALCSYQSKPLCRHSRLVSRGHEGSRVVVPLCVCSQPCSLLCIWQIAELCFCKPCTCARMQSVWAHGSVSSRITSKCIPMC